MATYDRTQEVVLTDVDVKEYLLRENQEMGKLIT